jgi:hypothetical protein
MENRGKKSKHLIKQDIDLDTHYSDCIYTVWIRFCRLREV